MSNQAETQGLWDLDEGLDFEKYTFTVDEALFGFPPEFDNPTMSLILNGRRNVEGYEDGHIYYGMGRAADFETNDGGRTIQSPTGQRIKGQSSYGKFLKAAAEVYPELLKTGNPYDSSTWEGMVLQLERKEWKFKINGEEAVQKVMIPVAIERKGSKASAASVNGTDKMVDKALELAKEADTYDDWVKAVMSAGLVKSAAVQKLISNKDDFDQVKAGAGL